MEDIIDIIVTETTNLITITSSGSDEVIDVNIIDNREDITLNVTPSVVEININSLTGNFGVNWGDIEGTLSNQTDLNTALGLKADLVDGKVPSSQLPSYVDDVVEVANYASLPVTGEVGKIYITLDTNYIYRWSGSTYIEIKDSSAVWGAITGTLSSQTDLQTALDAKQDDLNGTGFVKASGTTITYDNSTYLTTSSAASTYVPYTGATGNVDLGTHKLTSYDLVVNHASGSGVAVSITKGGSGEALTVVKSSGSGNAASITGGTTLLSELNVTGAITGTTATFTNSGSGIGLGVTQSGGTGDGIKITHSAGRAFNILSSGSGFGIIINNETASTSAPFTIQKQGTSVITLTDAGAGSFASSLTASSFIRSGGTSAQFLKADGSVDSSTYVKGSGTATYLASWTATANTLTNSAISYDGSITTVEAQGLSTLNGLDVQGNYGGVANAPKIRSYDATTSSSYIDFLSTGGRMYFGLNRSTANGMMTGATAYATVLTTGLGTTNLEFGTNLTKRLTIDGTSGAVTLTGALSGTSASFSGAMTSKDVYITNSANADVLEIFQSPSVLNSFIDYPSGRSLILRNKGTAGGLTLASTGAATFSSTGTFGGNVAIKTSISAYGLEVNDANGVKITTTGDARLLLNSSAASGLNWSLLSYTSGNFVIGRTGVSDLFTFTAAGSITLGPTVGTGVGALYAGAATFSGNVGMSVTSAYNIAPVTIGGNTMFMGTAADGLTNSVIGTISSQVRNYGAGIATSSFASIQFVTDGTVYYKGGMRFLVNNVDGTSTTPTTALTIASTGAATFSSSVTATKLFINSTDTGGDGLVQIVASVGTLGDSSKRRSLSVFSTTAENADQPGVILGYDTAGAGIVAARTNSAGQPLAFWTYNGSAWGERMRITSGGNVGIGTTAPGNKLQVVANVGSGGTGVVDIFNNGGTDNAPPLTLTKSSATTTSDARFIQFYASSQSQPMGGIVGNGANNVQFATVSDFRQKQNINKLDNSLNKIMGLNPVSFNWKNNNEFVQAGFIAQEVEDVFPEYVIQNMQEINGVTYKGLTGGMTGGIVPVLVKAIQELKAELDTLKNK